MIESESPLHKATHSSALWLPLSSFQLLHPALFSGCYHRVSAHPRRLASLLSVLGSLRGFQVHTGDSDRCSHLGQPSLPNISRTGPFLVNLSGQVPTMVGLDSLAPDDGCSIFLPTWMLPQKEHRTSSKIPQGFRATLRGPPCPPLRGHSLPPTAPPSKPMLRRENR